MTQAGASSTVSPQSLPWTALKFKQQLPIIRDDDTDYKKHRMKVQRQLDGYVAQTNGRQKLSPNDVLNLLQRTFPTGSQRARLYDMLIDRATRLDRLPEHAETVLAEVDAKLETFMKEADFTKQLRLEQ